MLIFNAIIAAVMLTLVFANNGGYSGSYGSSGYYPPDQQQQNQPHQQQQQQQQQQQPQPLSEQNDQRQRPPPPSSQQGPPGYYGQQQGSYPRPQPLQQLPPSSSQFTGYGDRRGPPGHHGMESGGLFGKLKSSIASASSAIAGSLDQQGPTISSGANNPYDQYYRGPPGPPGSTGPPGASRNTFRSGPPSTYYGSRDSTSPYQEDQGGLFGKIKNLFGADESQQNQGQQRIQNSPPGYRQPPPRGPPSVGYGSSYTSSNSDGYSGGSQQRPPNFYPPIPPSRHQAPPSVPNVDPYQQPQDPAISDRDRDLNSMSGINRPVESGRPESDEFNSQNPSFGHQQRSQQQSEQQQQQPQQSQGYPQHQYGNVYNTMAPVPPIDPVSQIPSYPQVVVTDDKTVVMILKPRELLRKKLEMIKGGPSSFQVFSDFEHVFTKFHTDGGQRTVGSAELLECSNALSQQAQAELIKVSEEFESESEERELDDDKFEELTQKCQSVVASQGNLHIGSIGIVTKENLPKLGLRNGWSESLKHLSNKGVPVYIFSSGYGDVVTQAILTGTADKQQQNQVGGYSSFNAMGMGPQLPQNMRIISNFFRSAPDGTVRAFSQPIVHERNKNSTTAGRMMGMKIPDRPYAITIGAHEDDATAMVADMNLKEHISIGYMELSDDLVERLPTYLNSFDAVVIGEGSFNYIKNMIEEILELPTSASSKKEDLSEKFQGDNNRLGFLRKGLGSLFLGDQLDSQQQQQSPSLQSYNTYTAQNQPQQGFRDSNSVAAGFNERGAMEHKHAFPSDAFQNYEF